MTDIEAQLRLNAAKAENERLTRLKFLRESYGINFYRPHAKQHLFHTTDVTSRYGRTGNRFGKSEMGICEDIAWCMGGRTWYQSEFDVVDGNRKVVYHHPGGKDHPFVTVGIPNRPVKGLLIVENWKKAKQVFTNREGSRDMWGKLFRFLPDEFTGKITRSTGGDIIQVEIKRPAAFGGGSSTLTIDTVQSYKNSPQSAESADWDFIHIDEPCPEGLFKAHARGLMDRNGHAWFTCTPLDEMWINDKFSPEDSAIVEAAAEGQLYANKYIITGSISDNPHISAAGRDEFLSTLTADEITCRRDGLPLAMAGLVYKEFKYDVHVLRGVPKGWDNYHLPPKNYTVRVAFDVHGARKNQAILLVATAPTGEVFVYDEQWFEPLIGPNAELLKKKIAPYFVVDQLIDPRALVVNPVTGTADILDKLAEYDLYFDPGSKDMMEGISATKEKLNERHVVTGNATIFFSPNLKRTIFEFTHYIFDTEKNVPKDKDDDMLENLRRLVLNGLHFVERPSDADWAAVRQPFTIKDNVDLEMESPRNLHL